MNMLLLLLDSHESVHTVYVGHMSRKSSALHTNLRAQYFSALMILNAVKNYFK